MKENNNSVKGGRDDARGYSWIQDTADSQSDS